MWTAGVQSGEGGGGGKGDGSGNTTTIEQYVACDFFGVPKRCENRISQAMKI
jgi:hypothetical protein